MMRMSSSISSAASPQRASDSARELAITGAARVLRSVCLRLQAERAQRYTPAQTQKSPATSCDEAVLGQLSEAEPELRAVSG